ncbi:MAG: ATP-binding protein [Verrucomicrobia bacterium]|nr:ATP-binding protein [Verrucomicrobiota bacterium]
MKDRKDTSEETNPAIDAQQKELASLAQTIRDYQTKREWSDTLLCKKFGGLGSTKTFTKILKNELEELDLERWLLEYRSVVNLITAEAGADTQDEQVFDDLSTCSRLRVAFLDIMNVRGNNRLIICEGASGSGKSKAARMLAAKYGRRVLLGEADGTWRSENTMLGGLLRLIGKKDFSTGTNERKELLIVELQARRVCICIDEAHHLGPASLNMLKTLINQTPGEFILFGLKTLLNRLETKAFQEALQLTRNRMAERISFDKLDAHDVEMLVKRRLGWLNGEGAKAARMLILDGKGPAQRLGHLAFVDAVCRQARKDADGEPVTLEIFSKAMPKVEAAR